MRISVEESRKRDLLRLRGIGRATPLIGPQTLQLHITNRCNLACRYCYYHSPSAPARMKQELSFARFRRMVADCLDLQVNAILLSGEGEPTVHPRFWDMLAYLKPLPFQVNILYNGTFPFRRCRDMVQADCIRINLAAVERSLYRTLHGRDLLHRVIANIQELGRLRKDVNPGCRIEIIFVINRLNEAHQKDMACFARDMGVDDVMEVPVELSPYSQGMGVDPLQASPGVSPQHCRPCFFSWYNTFVRVDGRVNICCYLDRPVIADLRRISLKKAWMSAAYARVRAMALSEEFRQSQEACRGCREWQKNREIALKLAAYRDVAPSREKS